jgi:hypothetical protein
MARYRYTCDPINPARHSKKKAPDVTFEFHARNDAVALRSIEKLRMKVVGPVRSEELEEGRRKGREFIPQRSVFRNQHGVTTETPQTKQFNVN